MVFDPIIETKSRGLKRCEMLIEKMKDTGKSEFTELDIKNLISIHIGISAMTLDRYLFALLKFNLIKKLESGNYALA